MSDQPAPRPRRKEIRGQRRRKRAATAETPTEQLAAAYDYLRGCLARADTDTADSVRRKIARQLLEAGDELSR